MMWKSDIWFKLCTKKLIHSKNTPYAKGFDKGVMLFTSLKTGKNVESFWNLWSENKRCVSCAVYFPARQRVWLYINCCGYPLLPYCKKCGLYITTIRQHLAVKGFDPLPPQLLTAIRHNKNFRSPSKLLYPYWALLQNRIIPQGR